MAYPITIERVEKILGKRRTALVEEIVQDEDVTEIVLKYPYVSVDYDEISHVYGHHNFKSWGYGFPCTIADYRNDVISWFYGVTKDPKRWNYHSS